MSEENNKAISTTISMSDAPGSQLPRYTRLHRNLIWIPLLAALIPLAIMAAINYRQDANAYRAESHFVISRILSNTKRSLQFAIEERRAVLSLVARTNSRSELSSETRLMSILRDLRESFGDFVDLGLIASDGNQAYYSGPYQLKGVNYSDQPWFHEVALRGTYVSDVFMGYRHLPHFVVAVAINSGEDDFYILRATIDTELLMRQIYSLDLGAETDAFVVNSRGILQTASAFYGEVLDTVDFTIPPHVREREIIDEQPQPTGGSVAMGFAYVEGTPFILVAATRLEPFFQHWFYQRSDVIWFLLLSAVGILAVVWYRSRNIIARLREADAQRAKIFHNVEYTNKMATLGRLAAGVAHEINNPLAIINEKAGLLQDMAQHAEQFPQREKILKIVDAITNSVDRCSRVTRRLLGFGRRMDAVRERIDLRGLINDVLEFQKTEAAHRSIKIDVECEETVPQIQSDRGQLQQVFLNLVGNSYGAVADGGWIRISIKQLSPSEVAVSVTDNGHGIPASDLNHVFEPFFSTKGQAGTGLGLSITRDIVEKLGGIIEVTSEVGKGTTFTVNLPIEKVD
ncbi:MAG TPA: ATP-binding protein [candidate division Zixibacteria bacterium]|nr:ATP-binding protein [candidate division Zixibacteria bacterium]